MSGGLVKVRALALAACLAVSVVVVLGTDARPAQAAPATINVPADWPTLEIAIAAAVDGDTIVVAPGTYDGNVDTGGKDLDIRSSGGPGVTTIRGAEIGEWNVEHPIATIGPAGSLQGFTITDLDSRTSSAVVVRPGPGTTVIRGNRFTGLRSRAMHGPMAISASSSVLVDRNTFSDNSCSGGRTRAGGIVYVHGGGRVLDNVFTDNACGAAISAWANEESTSTPQIVNNSIVRNPTGIEMGGLVSSGIVRNNVITDNDVGLTLAYDTDPPIVDHNLVSYNYDNWAGESPSYTGVDGNIGGVPGFVDDTSNLEPRSGSPLVDAGSATGAPTVDFDGRARVGAVDIGAFERHGDEATPSTTGGLDLTWGGDGFASIGSRYQVALGPLPSGRLYAGSWRDSDGGPMRVTRFDPDGSLDERYGSGGYLKRAFTPDGKGFSYPYEVLPSGSRLVVVGEVYTTGGRERVGIARLTTTGAYDTTFSSDGRLAYRIFTKEHDLVQPMTVRILPDGRMSVAVAAFDLNGFGAYVFAGQAIFRLRTNGTLDPTFSGDGIMVVPDSWSEFGFTADGGAYVGRYAGTKHSVRRMNPSGALDPTYGGDGVTSVECGNHVFVTINEDRAGRAVLACQSERVGVDSNDSDAIETVIRLARFTAAGELDPSWSGDGVASLSFVDRHGPGTYDRRWWVLLEDDGTPWIEVGSFPTGPSKGRILDTYTYDADGELDPAFSADGHSRLRVDTKIDLEGVAVGGGRIYTALGLTKSTMALMAVRTGG